ncbi:GroES-like protein [Pleurostoma richardsiae]|uniref:GroES-like protein n=1 Tax=Pleurostoma richardsiae TaxID=41990 RepID=A0AA38VNP1_9PEZI|nr:GroES-like protein [Pleurostoma richardsiae]
MPVQYQATKLGGPFAIVTVPEPKPGANEVIIRTKAIGLNPLDWKSLRFGVMVESWPKVLGIDGAGVVESVGEGVTSFQPGDEVFSLAGGSKSGGSYQELYVVPEHFVAKKPASLSFEEAATLPICFITAVASIVVGLKIPLPGLGKEKPSTELPQSILVLGGSSAIGANSIQLLRLALPSASIIATSSPAHHERLMSLGATKCLDRAAQKDAAAIKAVTPGAAGVDAILDAVAAASSDPAVFDALKTDGPKLYGGPVTGQNVSIPDGIQGTSVFGQQTFGADGGIGVMSFLASLIEQGKYELPTKVEVVGKGFEAIEVGLNKLMQGVSGTKLVVSL